MPVIINNQTFPTEFLSSPEEMQQGMMGRDSLDGCLVFKVGFGTHSFHMKNCKISLDIVFVNKKTISKIHPNCEPCNGECTKHYSGIGDHVLEFPSGTANGWNVGDRVNLYLGTKQNPAY